MPYPVALALTQLIEVPIYVAVLRALDLLPTGRAVAVAVGINLVTHPVVWAVLVDAGDAYPLRFVLAETAAILVEAALLYVVVRRHAMLEAASAGTSASALPETASAGTTASVGLLVLLAVTANAASALAGLAVAWLG